MTAIWLVLSIVLPTTASVYLSASIASAALVGVAVSGAGFAATGASTAVWAILVGAAAIYALSSASLVFAPVPVSGSPVGGTAWPRGVHVYAVPGLLADVGMARSTGFHYVGADSWREFRHGPRLATDPAGHVRRRNAIQSSAGDELSWPMALRRGSHPCRLGRSYADATPNGRLMCSKSSWRFVS